MADWRDQVGPATFRNVDFNVEVAERSGGRRTVRHDYPFRDQPFVEDLGRQGRSFTIEGYVLGDDYIVQRDRLISALEDTSGPGELVHPYYGTLQVVCANFRVRESTTDGGLARFSIDFLRTDTKPVQPGAEIAAEEAVGNASDDTLDAIRARIAARKAVSFTTSQLAGPASVISSASDSMKTALAPLVADAQGLANTKKAFDDIALDAVALARQPADALDAFLGAVSTIGKTPAIPLVGALLKAYGFTPSVDRPPEGASSRNDERDLWDLLAWMLRLVNVQQAARLAPGAPFDSYEAAVAIRDDIVAKLNAQADESDDDTFEAMEQLRAELVRGVPGPDSDLPHLAPFTPPVTLPSLLLSQRLYGDVAHEQDLIDRNRVVRPGFVPGGVGLQVLSP